MNVYNSLTAKNFIPCFFSGKIFHWWFLKWNWFEGETSVKEMADDITQTGQSILNVFGLKSTLHDFGGNVTRVN